MTMQSSEIKSIVISTLNSLGYPYQELAPKTIQFRTDAGRVFRVSMDYIPFIYLPVNFNLQTVRSHSEAAVLVNEANKRTNFGFFELSDHDEYIIFYHLGTSTVDFQFTQKLFFEMISAAEIELPFFENGMKMYLLGNIDLSQAISVFDDNNLKSFLGAYNESNPANTASVYRAVKRYIELNRYRNSLTDDGQYRLGFMIDDNTHDRFKVVIQVLDQYQVLKISAEYVFDKYAQSRFRNMEIAAGSSNYPGKLGCFVFEGGKFPSLSYKASLMINNNGVNYARSFGENALSPLVDFIHEEMAQHRGRFNSIGMVP